MSQIAIRPAASPLDVFMAPEVRREAPGADLIQLGDALSSFNQNLSHFTRLKHKAEMEESAAEAEAILQERRYKNMAALKAAVEAGEIHPDSNPWRYTFLKQLVAKEEIRGAALQWEQEYNSNPELKYSDGTAKVEAFLDEKIQAMADGRSIFELETMGPEAREFRHSFIANHLSRRSKERDQETETQFRRDISGLLQNAAARGFMSEGADTEPDITDLIAKAQTTIDTADNQAAIHPDVIRKWAVGAVVDSAVAFRSPELAERVLGNLSVQGKTLTSTLPPGGMEEIRSTIAKKALEEFELEAAKERHDTDRAFKAALSTFDKWKTTNPGASPFDQDAVDVASLDPQVRVRFQAWLNRVAEDDAARVLGDALGTELAGDATPQSRASVTALLFALHQPGTVAQYRDLQRMMAGDQWGNLSPTDAGDLMKVLFDGAKSPAEKYTFLESLAKTNRISQSDFQNYAPLAFRGVGDEISTGLWRNTANSLESQITAAWVQDQRLDGSPESKAEMDAVVGQAHRELGEAFLRFRSEKPNATFDEMSTFLNQQLDVVAGRVGGWTSERLRTGAAFITTRLRYETDPSLPGWQPPEVGPDLRWRDGKFIYSSGNITQPADKPIRLFGDLDDWKKRRSDVGLRLGIEGEYTPERWKFYAEQAKMIGPEAERQALEDLLSFTLLKEDLDLRRDKLARIDPMIETLKSSLRKEQQRRKTENPGLSRTVFEQSLMWSIEQHEQRRDELRRGVKVREAQDGVGL